MHDHICHPTIRRVLAVCAFLLGPLPVQAQVPLADQPVFTSVNVPGNMALALSVEFPTAISVAHPNRTYAPGNTYIGYFDPAKCYRYRYTDGTSDDNYFYPVGNTSDHQCNNKWSGNYLNWASMQTIDPFRWALTGGYRKIDTPTLTVLEKAWGSDQGSDANFPDSALADATVISGATPYSGIDKLSTRIRTLGAKIRFATPSEGGDNGADFVAKYYNNTTLNGGAVLTRNEGYISYEVNSRWFPAGVNTSNVSASWTGKVTAPAAGNYSFKIRGDDGVRLTVQINNGPSYTLGETGWRNQAAADYFVAVPNVLVGDKLKIWVEYYQGGGGAEVSLQWQIPGATTYSNVGGGGTGTLSGPAVHYNPANALQAGRLYEAFVRVKVCDSSSGAGTREANCVAFPNGNYKPMGLMQKYADKIRYSAFGYLNDNSLTRDGGVLRAAQKFIGPTQPVPGSLPASNLYQEWDSSDGTLIKNPDTGDATATNTALALGADPKKIVDSGVINYLNKFGSITASAYKTYDPVSELYYATLRYFRNLGNVPSWSSMDGADLATRIAYADGFPVITDWKDPIPLRLPEELYLGHRRRQHACRQKCAWCNRCKRTHSTDPSQQRSDQYAGMDQSGGRPPRAGQRVGHRSELQRLLQQQQRADCGHGPVCQRVGYTGRFDRHPIDSDLLARCFRVRDVSQPKPILPCCKIRRVSSPKLVQAGESGRRRF